MRKRFHEFRGVRYEVKYPKRMKVSGDVQPPDTPGTPVMRIKGSLEGALRLDTEIHEALHACLWDLDEEAILEIAGDIAAFLYSSGYRIRNPQVPGS